jgi:hypothetical protein
MEMKKKIKQKKNEKREQYTNTVEHKYTKATVFLNN